jgi:hypothetical protein
LAENLRNFYPYLNFWKKQLYTQDVFGKCYDVALSNKVSIPELEFNGTIHDLCRDLIHLSWQYNAKTRSEIQKCLQQVDLPEEYVGLHVRKGDKYVEAKLLDTKVYMDKLQSLYNLKNVFLLTDDYSVVKELENNYINYTFFTLCETTEAGYTHANFMEHDSKFKRQHLLKLFASVDALANAKMFLGTLSTNPGLYLLMKMKKGTVYSADDAKPVGFGKNWK